MRAACRLGLRLSWPHAPAARWRSATMVGAAAIAAFAMLAVLAVTHAEQVENPSVYADPGMRRVLLATVLAISLPVLVLLSAAAKLSAQLRERRLANLRLLGLSPALTRVVAVTEVALSAAVGALLGTVTFLLLRPPLSSLSVAGRSWQQQALTPTLRGYGGNILAVTFVVVLVAGWPRAGERDGSLAVARRSQARRPSWLRLLPLFVGVVLCQYVLVGSRGKVDVSSYIPPFLVGVGLLGLGVILLVPIFVRLVADLLVSGSSHAVLVIAGRRLQAQPAAVNRVVSGLVIGLFLVTGARGVVVAFESTPQYVQAASQLDDVQTTSVETTMARADDIAARTTRIPGVIGATVFAHLSASCHSDYCPTAIVATCAQVRALAPGSTGCSDAHPTWVGDARTSFSESALATLRWHAGSYARHLSGPSVDLPAPTGSITGLGAIGVYGSLVNGVVVIPPQLAGVRQLVPTSTSDVVVVAGPGRDLADKIARALPRGGYSVADFESYDFVAKLRALVWAIAIVIVSLGLLTFALTSIDRAIARRREVVALQIVGVGRSVLRSAQWVEAAVPLIFGCALAIGCGLLASATYLAIGGEGGRVPWHTAITLGLVAALGSVFVAGLTVVASSPRIRADLIRSE